MYLLETVTESKSGQRSDRQNHATNELVSDILMFYLLKLHFRARHMIYIVVTNTY